MIALEGLLACAGCWRGTNHLHVSADAPGEESPSEVVVTPLSGGRFVRVDQTWAWHGSQQVGSLLVGYDDDCQVVVAHWIDTFHASEKVMACSGMIDDDTGTLNLLGWYSAPDGPDWGWRITIDPHAPGRLDLRMFNIDPAGHEALAVQATHTPA